MSCWLPSSFLSEIFFKLALVASNSEVALWICCIACWFSPEESWIFGSDVLPFFTTIFEPSGCAAGGCFTGGFVRVLAVDAAARFFFLVAGFAGVVSEP